LESANGKINALTCDCGSISTCHIDETPTTALITNLNADLLDGYHASSMLNGQIEAVFWEYTTVRKTASNASTVKLISRTFNYSFNYSLIINAGTSCYGNTAHINGAYIRLDLDGTPRCYTIIGNPNPNYWRNGHLTFTISGLTGTHTIDLIGYSYAGDTIFQYYNMQSIVCRDP